MKIKLAKWGTPKKNINKNLQETCFLQMQLTSMIMHQTVPIFTSNVSIKIFIFYSDVQYRTFSSIETTAKSVCIVTYLMLSVQPNKT